MGDEDLAWHTWRRPLPTPAQQRQDVLIALAALIGAVAAMVLINSMGVFPFGHTPPLWEQLAWAAGLTLPLIARRRYPLIVLVIVGAMFIASQARQVGDNLMPSLVLFMATYTVGAWERNRFWAKWARIAVIIAMFLWLAYGMLTAGGDTNRLQASPGPLDPVLASVLYTVGFNLLFFVGAYFFGNVAWLAARREAELRLRAEELRLSQEQNTRGAIVAERVRIARDLHDVVAHHVSVMGVQAGAARRVLEKTPDVASEALRTVEQTARTAINELRGLLGVLRAEDSEIPRTHEASPGLDQLRELVLSAQQAGLDVEHGIYGEPRPVPQGVALSAYRVVQEALTNVVKHAGARKADVRVRYLDTALEVEVTDDGRGAVTGSNGFGLLGMRERVAVHGGELEAGPRRDGGYRVRVSLPTT